jgi:hypothetical protein
MKLVVKVAGSCTYGEKGGTKSDSGTGREEGGKVPGAGCQVRGVGWHMSSSAVGEKWGAVASCADRPPRGRGDVGVEYVAG